MATKATNGIAQEFWAEILDLRSSVLDDIRERRAKGRAASKKQVRVRTTTSDRRAS